MKLAFNWILGISVSPYFGDIKEDKVMPCYFEEISNSLMKNSSVYNFFEYVSTYGLDTMLCYTFNPNFKHC